VATALFAAAAIVVREPGYQHQRVDVAARGAAAHAVAAVLVRARDGGDRLLDCGQSRDAFDERMLGVVGYRWPPGSRELDQLEISGELLPVGPS